MDRGRDFLIGLVLGATIGALAALLLAPQSGAETRKMLAEKSSQIGERFKDMSTTVRDRTETILSDIKRSIDDLKAKLAEKRSAKKETPEPAEQEA